MLMASDATEDRVVGRVDVAIGAGGPFALVRSRVDGEPGVIERGAQPGRGVMTYAAIGREVRGNVIGILHAGVVGLVARVAIGRRTGEAPADVATGAGNAGVSAGQRE